MGKSLLNRDVSHLAFNARVADEAFRKRARLEEKLTFLGIAQSNLAEFLSVRYPASLEESPEETGRVVKAIGEHYLRLVHQYEDFNKKHRIIKRIDKLDKDDRKWLDKYFRQNIFPALSPITVDKARKANIHGGLYVLTIMADGDDQTVGYIEVPRGVDRFIQVDNHRYAVAVEDLIQDHLKDILRGRKVVKSCPFSILRSAEVYDQSDFQMDPYEQVKKILKERENSWVTALEIGTTSKTCIKTIRKMVPMEPDTIIFASERIRMADLRSYPSEVFNEGDRSRRFEPYTTFPVGKSLFSHIKNGDRLCTHPFESYDDSMVRFIEEAAEDSSVVSIRITLYRVSDNSRIINALLKAADKGKLVTVLVELKARFDEKHNMKVANILREGGVRILYTKPDIKTHAKLCLVTRKEKKGLRTYSVVATGNFSETNSKLYVDYTYYTADQDVGEELVKFFNLMTSDQEDFKAKHIIYAPYNLKSTIIDEIEHQIKRAKEGKKSRIIVKCNAITDEGVAKKLIEAAEKGVRVQLIVRSACIIQPQKNLTIRSIVGRWLEHSRLYAFQTGKDDWRVYLGSADLMVRNLSRRNELLIQVDDKDSKKRLLKHLEWYLKDNVNARIIQGSYKYEDAPAKKGEKPFDVQDRMRREAKQLANEA